MTDEITAEIRDAVNKHLPSTVGEALQLRLKQAERDARDVVEIRADVARQEKVVDRHLQTIAELKTQLAQHAALDERERAVEEAERKQEIFALKTKLEASEGSRDFARNVALGLVRNTDFREVVHHSNTTPVPVTTNGYTAIQGHTSHNRNESTRTAE